MAFRFKKNEQRNTLQLFDIIRKKFVDLTPEEWVRQHVIHYLVTHKNVPKSMLSVEKQLILNHTKKRTDVVVFHSTLKPVLIVECKAAHQPINQLAIDQALRYHLKLRVPFVFLSNGFSHITLNMGQSPPLILTDVPDYAILTKNT